MTTHTTPARFSDPIPTIADARKAIRDHVTRDAIDAYEDSRRRHADYATAIADDGYLDIFDSLNRKRLDDARDHLVRVLLARSLGPLDYDHKSAMALELVVHKTTGVVSGGRFYLASVRDEYSTLPVGKFLDERETVMKLVHGDLSDLVTPGDVEDLDTA